MTHIQTFTGENREEIKARTMSFWQMMEEIYEEKVDSLINSGAVDIEEWIDKGAALPRALACVAFEHCSDQVKPFGKASELLPNLRKF